jgi:hypothetical protein
VLPHGVGTFSVTDTGIGMSRDQLRLVFEPYVQFENEVLGGAEGDRSRDADQPGAGPWHGRGSGRDE